MADHIHKDIIDGVIELTNHTNKQIEELKKRDEIVAKQIIEVRKILTELKILIKEKK